MARTKAKKTTAGRKSSASKTKKITAKKASASKAVSKKAGPVKEVHNKSQIFTYISECTELSKKEVKAVFDSLSDLMERHLKKSGPGEFTVPGLMKCVVKRKPATKARKGVNPFTGEEMMFKAKPARNIVKVRPLKKLKEMVE